MDTFWLKIAAGAVAVVVAIVVVSMFLPHGPQEPAPPEKTFYDQAEQDKEKFLAEPKPLENQQETPVQPQQPAESQTEAAPAQPTVAPPKPAEPTVIYCKPLSEIDDIEAQRLLNVAVPGRSIGRLPMTGFKLMVDTSRQIIQRWPDSWYAYRAKQMLADMPERWRQNYKITEEEMDVSRFAQPRPGTQPFTIKETR
jgi:type IV secretory pathway VirB10-like protein